VCDLEREIGLRLSGRILGVHPFATLIMPLRLVEGKSPVFRARASLASRPAGRWKRAGYFATGDEKVLEESKEKAAAGGRSNQDLLFYGRFLPSPGFLLQNYAILCNALKV